jgi:hypothetical protein
MADKKISQLTGASTPLAGTEVLPIVQSGSTVKVSAADVTAGRAVSAASVAVTGSTAPANGVYLPAANSVGVATNSGERLRVNATGEVGVGTTAPRGDVDISSGSTTTSVTKSLHLGYSAANFYGFRVANTNAAGSFLAGTFAIQRGTGSAWSDDFTISDAGNVAIATGNLQISTAGKGIDFSANTGNVLTQYKTASHTPTWTATSVNPALGNGTLNGSYVQIGNNCMFQFSFTMGSTTTFGTGEWEFTAPFTASKTGVGSAWALDSGTAYYIGAAKIEAGSNKVYIWTNAGVTAWSATAPFTWAANDRIEVGISFTV